MTTESNAQDKAVSEYLATQGVTFTAALVGEIDRDGWTCDEWRIKLVKRAQSGGKAGELSTAYFTGTGHRAPMKRAPVTVRAGDPVKYDSKTGKWFAPVAPTAASVLYSLLLDASSADENFYDWCANCGYDTDSRKALSTYEACCSIRADVHKLFTHAEREALAVILENY